MPCVIRVRAVFGVLLIGAMGNMVVMAFVLWVGGRRGVNVSGCMFQIMTVGVALFYLRCGLLRPCVSRICCMYMMFEVLLTLVVHLNVIPFG